MRKLKSFLKDETGNFAIIASLLTIPLMLTVGLSVDYSNILQIKTSNQDALDAAVLAASQQNDSLLAKKAAEEAYQTNNGIGDVALLKLDYNKTSNSLKVAGSIEIDAPLHFGSIFGRKTAKIQLYSTAESSPYLDEIRISAIGAQGAWSKDMDLMAVDRNGTTPEKIGWTQYRYWSEYGRGSSAIYRSSNLNNWISLRNKKSVYFKMRVYSWSGTFDVSMLAPRRYSNIVVSDTNGRNKVKLPLDKPVELASIIPCGKEKKIWWEDGGTDVSAWDGQDFWFNVTGKCVFSEKSTVKLTR